MIVTNLNVFRTFRRPCEADSILIIDANGILTGSITFEPLKSITGRYSEIIQSLSNVQLHQLTQCDPFKWAELYNTLQPGKLFRVSVCEGSYHDLIITPCVINVKREYEAITNMV